MLPFYSNNLIYRRRTLYTQSCRITFAPPVLPRLLARVLVGTTTYKVFIFRMHRTLQTIALQSFIDIAESNLRSLLKIPHCWLIEFGPCLSSNVAVHSLKPAKDCGLGKPLPYQLPNPHLNHLSATKSFCYYYLKIIILLSILLSSSERQI